MVRRRAWNELMDWTYLVASLRFLATVDRFLDILEKSRNRYDLLGRSLEVLRSSPSYYGYCFMVLF